MRSLIALGIAMVLAAEAQAAKVVAVLPIDVSNTEGKLSNAGRVDLEEMLRDVGTNALAGEGWTILTGETTLQVLKDNGVDPTKCGDQSCHLSMAREIKADKFLSGNIRYVDGSFSASIRLIDTATGRIQASQSIEGPTVTALRKAFAAKSDDFFRRAGMLGGAAAPAAVPAAPPATTGWGIGTARKWRGDWSSATSRFTFVLTLSHTATTQIAGQFDWRNSDTEQTGIEWVKGTCDAACEQLDFAGYRVSDENVLSRDNYKVTIDSKGALTGKSVNGKLQGQPEP